MFYTKKIFIFILLLSICANAKDLEKVSIQLDWFHQFQFAGYYIAKEKGFYKQKGLDVTIKELSTDKNIVKSVLQSKGQYAVGKSSLIEERMNDKKIILLSAIFQDSPLVLIVKKDSNINYPYDLKNKKIMLTPSAKYSANINAMLISQGLSLDDVKFIKHSFDINDLIYNKTDAIGCYLSNEPYILEQREVEYKILNPRDYGFNFYGGIFFTSEKELKDHPLRVKKMYEATLKGWEYTFNHIQESAQIIFQKYNTNNKSFNAILYEARILKRLSKIDEGLLGNIDNQRVEKIQKIYTLLGFCKKDAEPPKVSDYIYKNRPISN